MPTKLYLLTKDAEYVPTAWQGGWNATFGSAGFMDTSKFGVNPNLVANDSDKTLTPWRTTLFRGVSRKLNPQTISGTVDFVLGCHYLYGTQWHTRLHIYVVNATTNTVHGTLLNMYEENTSEWAPSTNTGRALVAPQTLTSVTIPNDANQYRLVAEIGAITYYTGMGIMGARLRVGARNSTTYAGLPDLVVGSTTTQDEAGFLSFSADIVLGSYTAISNSEPEFAIDIGTLPASITVDPLSNDNQMWYKYTPTIDEVLHILCCHPTDDSYATIFLGNGIPLDETTYSASQPSLWPVKPGTDVYFACYIAGYTSGMTLNLKVSSNPKDPVQEGDLMIPDDSSNINLYDPTIRGFQPCIWYTPTGTVRRADAHFPSNELGSCLSNGKWAIIETFDIAPNAQRLFIYDKPPGIAELLRVQLPGPYPAAYIRTMGTDFKDFYIAHMVSTLAGTPSKIYKVTDSGTLTGPIATLAVTGMGSAGASGGNFISGVSRDGSIFYYPEAVLGGKVHRHNLLTDTPVLPPFDPPSGGPFVPYDTLVLSDGSIVTIFQSGTESKLVHYSATGVILHNKDFESYPWELHHIVHEGTDHPDKVWCWDQNTYTSYPERVGKNRFQLLELSTGTFLQSWTRFINEGGNAAFDPTNGCNPQDKWGAPSSCPLMIMMDTSASAPDVSGIYFINSAKATNHDSYYDRRTPPGPADDVEKKIPNPTIKTALIGE